MSPEEALGLQWAAGAERPRPDGQVRTRVLVVDDHRAVAEPLGMAISMQADLECVGIASTAAEALRLAVECTPDVVLTDVVLPDMDGIDAARELRELHPAARVIVLTAHTDLGVMARAASMGACGFLPKESSVLEILNAVRTARNGGMVVDGSTLTAVIGRLKRDEWAPSPAENPLTQREASVLAAMGQGLDPQAIAAHLGISVNTCRGYVKSILAKLGAHSQLEAVVVAARRGLLPPLGGDPSSAER